MHKDLFHRHGELTFDNLILVLLLLEMLHWCNAFVLLQNFNNTF
jgi:hypothetical protein